MYIVIYITNNIHRLLVLAALLFLLLPSQQLFAATLQVVPPGGVYSVGQTFTVTVSLNPAGQAVSAAEGIFIFDPALLSVVSVSKGGSVFSTWSTEPTFSNNSGTLVFAGSAASPFSSAATLIMVTLRAVAPGDGIVSFSDASVHANDGAGTNLYERSNAAVFTVATATAPETTSTNDAVNAQEESVTNGDWSHAPVINSSVFFDPTGWYNSASGTLSWQLPDDVDAVAVHLATSSHTIPSGDEAAIFEPPITEFVVTPDMVSDGVQYMNIQYRHEYGWGVTTSYPLQIDTEPPAPFAITLRIPNIVTDFLELAFDAHDITSGIEYYTVILADREPLQLTPREAEQGYLVRDLADGVHSISVVAHDRAGNTREAQLSIQVHGGWMQSVATTGNTALFTNVLIVSLSALVGWLVIMLLYLRAQQSLREEKLRHETAEIQDQTEKIFSALRYEIHDQIATITMRKRLTKKEKEVVDGLNQALEVSETLLEKEINDVTSILK